MAALGSLEFYDELAKLLNDDEEWLTKGKAISYSMVCYYDAPVNKAFFLRFDEGRVVDVRQLPSADAEPADFVISGSPGVWRDVCTKKISPTSAMTRRQLEVKGKMTTLLKNMTAFGYVIDAMTRIDLV